MFEKGKNRNEKIDKFLDTLAWYHSDKSTPTGFYATIGRIELSLHKFNDHAERLIQSIDTAEKSSEKLTTALNKITLAGVIVAGAGIFIALANLVFEIYKFSSVK
jgi:hypothetical protein